MRQKGKKRSTLNPRGSKHIGTKDWEGGRATLGEGRREIENLKDDNEKLKTKVKAGHNSTQNAQVCWSRLCHLKSKYALIQMRHLVKTYLFL